MATCMPSSCVCQSAIFKELRWHMQGPGAGGQVITRALLQEVATACNGSPLLLQLCGSALAHRLLPADALLAILGAAEELQPAVDG